MRKIAIEFVAAEAVLTAAPAMAQIGFYAGPGGVGIGVGAPGPYYRCGYDYPCDRGYYDYYSGPDVTFGAGPAWNGGWARPRPLAPLTASKLTASKDAAPIRRAPGTGPFLFSSASSRARGNALHRTKDSLRSKHTAL